MQSELITTLDGPDIPSGDLHAASGVAAPRVLDPVNILLVDDEPRNLDVLESLLSNPEYHLVRAQTADDALMALVAGDYACIILDIQMPGMTGIELARLIKTRKRTQHIPIIFLTAFFQEDRYVLEGYGVGAVDYLTKPINPQILKSKVSVFVELFRATRALRSVNATLEKEITQRLKAEEALRNANADLEARVKQRTADLTNVNRDLHDSEQRLRQLMMLMPAAVYACDAEGRITFYNRHAAELWGREPKLNDPNERYCACAKVLTPDGTLVPPDLTPIALTLRDGKPARYSEIIIERFDGSRVTAIVSTDPFFDDYGHVRGAINVFQDITPLRRATEDLRITRDHLALQLTDMRRLHKTSTRMAGARELEPMLRELLRAAMEVHATDMGLLSLCSPDKDRLQCRVSSGFSEEFLKEVESVPAGSGAWGTCFQRCARTLVEDVEAGPVFSGFRDAARREGFRAVHSTPLITRNGQIVGVLSVCFRKPTTPSEREQRLMDLYARMATDFIEAAQLREQMQDELAQRKRVEEALRDSESRYRTLMEQAGDGIYVCDREGRFLMVNSAGCELLGYTNEELLKLHIADTYPPEERTVSFERLKLLREGKAQRFERRMLRKDGSFVEVDANVTPLGNSLLLGIMRDITERKRVEQALRDSEQRFRTLASHAPVGIFLSDLSGRCTYVNEHWLRMAGLKLEQALGDGWIQAVHPDDRQSVLAGWKDALKNRAESPAEFRFLNSDGVVTWLQGCALPLRNAEGAAVGYIGTVSDITERKKAEEIHRRLAAIVESSSDAIVGKDITGIITNWNEGAEQLFGYTAEEIIGKSVTTLIPEERQAEELQILARLKTGERIEHFETVRQRKDGSLVTVSLTVSPIRNSDGEIIGAAKIARDITEQKRAEEALRQSEQRFRQLADSMPQMVWSATPNGCTDYHNRRWYETTGAPEKVTGDESFLPMVHPDDRERTVQMWHESVRTGKPYQNEYRIFNRSSGTYRWHLGRALPIRDDGGQIVRWFGTSTDIDDQKRTEERFVRLNEILVSVLEAIPDVVFVVNAEGGIEFKNPAATRFIREVGLENDLPEPVRKEIQSVLETRRHQLPKDLKALHSFKMSNGERHFLNRIVVMTGTDQQVFGAVAMLQDVTEFRLLDEVKTNLIATVSHELRTPITSVRNALHLLLNETFGPLNERQMEFVTLAHEEGERLLRTLNSLLDLTRFEDNGENASLEKCSPGQMVTTALDEVRGSAAVASVTVISEVEESLPIVTVDRERIIHVLTNLLTNAIKHSPTEGQIKLRACNHSEGVYFSVTDNGPGIPPQYQARIFEKFFRVPNTPKKGTGLGLWIARQFVQAHGGRIGIVSEPGAGCEVFFILPADHGDKKPQRRGKAGTGGGHRH